MNPSMEPTPKNNQKRMIIGLVAVCVILIAVVAVMCLHHHMAGGGTGQTATISDAGGASPDPTGADQGGIDPSKMTEISTPFATLQYPAMYAEHLVVSQEEEGDICKIVFSCNLDDQQYPLFTVYYHDAGVRGMLLGYLEQADGMRIPVSVEVEDGVSVDGPSANTYVAMQDGVNDVIDSLIGQDNFTEA